MRRTIPAQIRPTISTSRMMLMTSLLLIVFPHSTTACGGFFCEPSRPVVQSGESIVFGVDENNRVTMQVQILYEGPAEAFSWVLPLPFPPTIAVGSDLLFQSLFRQSLPTFELEIQNEASATCSSDALEPVQCLARPTEDFDMSETMEMAKDDAVVLEQGSVGPFDFTILQAADHNPDSVLTWLEDNGYDQPPDAAPLLNYYAMNDHVFVAVKLQKESATGDIQPLILTYDMPEEEDEEEEESTTTALARRTAMACVPLQLTSIAATDNMPIQVYIMGPARAVPLNFVELELDDTLVDWVTCLNNPGCYDDDYRLRFDRAANQLTNHSFVTEYAGPTTAVMTESIELQFTADEVAAVETWDDFQRFLPFLPDLPLVDSILQEYPPDETFDAVALSAELEEKLLRPAREAQAFVDTFPYLTRLYGRLSPVSMTKDPFFAFKPELADVSHIHRATGVPICQDGVNPSALSISVQNGTDSVQVPATIGCGGWISTGPTPVTTVPFSPARQLASWGFSGDAGVLVERSEDGTFVRELVDAALAFGDTLVMNQTIPDYTASTADQPTPAPVEPVITEAPDGTTRTTAPTASPTASSARVVSTFATLTGSLLLFARLS